MVKQVIKKCSRRFMLSIADQECIGHECQHYQKLRGNHPQTGEAIDEYKCTEEWSNILLIECSQQQRQTGAAVESLRNVVNAGNKKILSKQSLIESNKKEVQ